MGQAARAVGGAPGVLAQPRRGGGVDAQRSPGGHRRYSRRQLERAARLRELFDEGMTPGRGHPHRRVAGRAVRGPRAARRRARRAGGVARARARRGPEPTRERPRAGRRARGPLRRPRRMMLGGGPAPSGRPAAGTRLFSGDLPLVVQREERALAVGVEQAVDGDRRGEGHLVVGGPPVVEPGQYDPDIGRVDARGQRQLVNVSPEEPGTAGGGGRPVSCGPGRRAAGTRATRRRASGCSRRPSG